MNMNNPGLNIRILQYSFPSPSINTNASTQTTVTTTSGGETGDNDFRYGSITGWCHQGLLYRFYRST